MGTEYQEPSPEARRMQAAFDLHDLGCYLYRRRVRREYPRATEADIDNWAGAWLATPAPDDWPTGPPQITAEAVRAVLVQAGLALTPPGLSAYLLRADGLEDCVAVMWAGVRQEALATLGRCQRVLQTEGYGTERIALVGGLYLVAWAGRSESAP